MAANIFPWIALGGLALLAMRKDEAPPAVTTAAAPPPPTPPPTTPVGAPPPGIPPGTTFPTPGFVPAPLGTPPPPPTTPGAPPAQPLPPEIPAAPGLLAFSPPAGSPPMPACHYQMIRDLPGIHEEYLVAVLEYPHLFNRQATLEAGLNVWFQSVPLFPGQWLLIRNCGGATWTVLDTRSVLMVA